MKISKITNWLVAGAACLLLGTSCDVDPTFYSQVVPDTYYCLLYTSDAADEL